MYLRSYHSNARSSSLSNKSLPSYGDISKAKFDVDDIKGVDEVITASKPSGGLSSTATRKSSRKEKAITTEVKDESKSDSDSSKGTGKYEIVDMSMPSYSENTATKGKSVFSF